MPHAYRRTRAQYRKAAARLLAVATQCFWCGVPISTALPVGHKQKATADHYLPLSLGGSDDLSNLVPACSECNTARGNKTPAQFLAFLARKRGDGPEKQQSRDW